MIIFKKASPDGLPKQSASRSSPEMAAGNGSREKASLLHMN
jgi:hypothetical protein